MQKLIILVFFLAVVARLLFAPAEKIPMRIRCDGGEGQTRV